jgi:hypothetical protein
MAHPIRIASWSLNQQNVLKKISCASSNFIRSDFLKGRQNVHKNSRKLLLRNRLGDEFALEGALHLEEIRDRPQSAALRPCPPPLLHRPYPHGPRQQLPTTGGGLGGLAAVALLPLEVGISRRLGACGVTTLGAGPNYGASSSGFLTN